MATRNIVPRGNNEGSIGTILKRWLSGFFNWLNISQYIKFDKDMDIPTWEEGKVFYDKIHKTLNYYNSANKSSVNIAQERILRVYNNSGEDIPDGKVVYILGSIIPNGHSFPTIALAKADNPATASVIGVTTVTIPNNDFGFVTAGGEIHHLDLSEFDPGDTVYLSDTVAGGLTKIKPVLTIQIGFVISTNSADGILLVSLSNFGMTTGDMLQSIYDINSNNIVDKAEALNDGSSGGGNNVTASEARDTVDKAHEHSNKAEIDLVTDGNHDIRTDNPHNITPSQIGAVSTNQYQSAYIESETETTTTDTVNWQQKVRLTLTPAQVGYYIISWSAGVSNSGANKGTETRIRLDSTTELQYSLNAPISADAYMTISGFKRLQFTDLNTHTIDIDFKSETSSTAKIRRARIYIQRII